MNPLKTLCIVAALAALLHTSAIAGSTPHGSSISYQGVLKQGGAPLNATADLKFRLYGDPSGGTQFGFEVTLLAQTIADGRFTVSLDFGACRDVMVPRPPRLVIGASESRRSRGWIPQRQTNLQRRSWKEGVPCGTC